ncbi:hypothetical protein [Streptomyces sp. NPDC002088]|uniref:hypothetical protein n=1 Tax=Streptomyces sp. NPDC002088 TaxID=3154665 RepID=UPI00331EEF46
MGSHVQRTWGLHHPFPGDKWHFEVRTDHAPGEDMRPRLGAARLPGGGSAGMIQGD